MSFGDIWSGVMLVKGFSFRLEPVLKYRKDKEEMAVMAQSVAQKEHQDQLNILEDIRQRLEAAREDMPDRITAEECLARWLYIDFMADSQARQEDVVDRACRELEKRRQAVAEARRDKLVLQKLKDRQYRKYTEKLNRLEAKYTDDQCTVRFKGGDR